MMSYFTVISYVLVYFPAKPQASPLFSLLLLLPQTQSFSPRKVLDAERSSNIRNKLRRSKRSFMAYLLHQIHDRLERYEARQLANITWALGRL